MNRDWDKLRRNDRVTQKGAYDRRIDAAPDGEMTLSPEDAELLMKETAVFVKSNGPMNARMRRAIRRFRTLVGDKYADLSDDTIYRLACKQAADYKELKKLGPPDTQTV